MPKLDHKTLVGNGGVGGAQKEDNSKTTKETVFDNGDFICSEKSDLAQNQSDYPPQSVNLRKEDEAEWLDKNALFERKDSRKRNPNLNSISHSNSTTSQRFFMNLKSKASVIGLPKPQKSCFVASSRRNCRPSSKARFFPKRSRSSGKSSSVPLSEPSSPKVSCIGRVRSKKETIIAKSRSLRILHHSIDDDHDTNTKNPSTNPDKAGFWSNLRSVFRIGSKKHQSAIDFKEELKRSPSRKVAVAGKCKGTTVNHLSESPSLGGLKRFTSGRKSESWGGCELNFEENELDSCYRGSVFSRRGVSQLDEIDCSTRDWESVGPASV